MLPRPWQMSSINTPKFAQAIMFLTSMGEQDFSPELYLIPSALAGE
jgi:hypothetical protein